jgi:phage tail protein X
MATFPTSEKQYLTSAGDTVDSICWAYYGVTRITTERVLARNRWLTKYPPILPAGLLIVLPVVLAADVFPSVNLWPYKPTVAATKKPAVSRADMLAAQKAALARYVQSKK